MKGMPLKHFVGKFKPERAADILRSIPPFQPINDKPAADFWKEVDEKKP